MTITEAIDKKLGNESPSMTIAEALGHPYDTIADAIAANAEPDPEPGPSPEPTTFTVSYNANGGEGTIESDVVNEGSSINLPDGSAYTAPEGKVFLGWAKSSSAQSATVESPFTPDKDTELFAVWVDA